MVVLPLVAWFYRCSTGLLVTVTVASRAVVLAEMVDTAVGLERFRDLSIHRYARHFAPVLPGAL
jgi:hypothetical protein